MPRLTIDNFCFILFVLGMICSFLIPRCVDPVKLRQEDDSQLKDIVSKGGFMIPRRVLTPVGAQLWMARNILLALAVLLAFWIYFARS